MKALYTSLIVAGLIAITGCNTSPTGGGAGGTGVTRSTSATSRTGATSATVKTGESSHDTFKLKGPWNLTDISVKQGETIAKDVTVDAGKDFKEDIAFETKVDPEGKGVTATVEPKTWKASDSKKVELKITAANDAPKGEYTIHVTGKPASGQATTVNVKIKVPEKK